MNPETINYLRGWQAARLLDEAQVEAILLFESAKDRQAPARLRWPAILAISFGALLLSAGGLLFVAAHWDGMGPDARYLTVLAQVGLLHLAGAFCWERMPRLATALHGCGTLALGSAIFLAGQIFNLQEHWPGGVLLWALGAWFGYLLLRDWVQATLLALLTPCWLAGEWIEATHSGWGMANGVERILLVGLFGLGLAYLSARRGVEASLLRKALVWVGGLSLFPAVLALINCSLVFPWARQANLPTGLLVTGWTLAIGLPLAVAYLLRKSMAWVNLLAMVWAILIGCMRPGGWMIHAWAALGAIGLVAWGLYDERRERLNLGVAGFALTILCFYFSNVMDKLGRAFGLLGLGLLFLLGGWQLELLRRRLNARIREGGK